MQQVPNLSLVVIFSRLTNSFFMQVVIVFVDAEGPFLCRHFLFDARGFSLSPHALFYSRGSFILGSLFLYAVGVTFSGGCSFMQTVLFSCWWTVGLPPPSKILSLPFMSLPSSDLSSLSASCGRLGSSSFFNADKLFGRVFWILGSQVLLYARVFFLRRVLFICRSSTFV